jgi:hypothetical protein
VKAIPQSALQVAAFLLPTFTNGIEDFRISLVGKLIQSFTIPTQLIPPALANPNSSNQFGFSAPTATFADINGDGTPDLVVGLGGGYAPLVTVFDGTTLFDPTKMPIIIAQFFAYDSRFVGGVNTTAGNISGRINPATNLEMADIVVGAGQGGGANVSVFSYDKSLFNPNNLPPGGVFAYDSFNVYGNPPGNFYGGVRVAASDVRGRRFQFNGTLFPVDDIVTAPGVGGGPDVRVYGDNNRGQPALEMEFFAYDNFYGGVFVGAGDYVTGAGHADIVTGPGFGGSADIRVFDGFDAHLITEFMAFNRDQFFDPFSGNDPMTAGVSGVAFSAVTNPTAGGKTDIGILVGCGAGQPAEMRGFANIDNGFDPANPLPAPIDFVFDQFGNATDIGSTSSLSQQQKDNAKAHAIREGVTVGGGIGLKTG